MTQVLNYFISMRFYATFKRIINSNEVIYILAVVDTLRLPYARDVVEYFRFNLFCNVNGSSRNG